ncbi:MAG: DNA alkylation repair protein [Bellilinea sp.]
MPAVQLASLNQQIDALAQRFLEPVDFQNGLEALLVRYADLTYKPGQAVRQTGLPYSSYRTAPIVMRALEDRLAFLAPRYPEPAIAVAEGLWKTEKTEPRRLAAVLLGNLPAAHVDSVLGRLKAWSVPGAEFGHLEALFSLGSVRLRREDSQKWLEMIHTWLNSTDQAIVRLGVMAVTTLVHDQNFENLPAIFTLSGPLLAQSPGELQTELRTLLIQLARRSPAETAFFLRQVIGSQPSPMLLRIIRRCLPEFPLETQTRLRSLLQALPREDKG